MVLSNPYSVPVYKGHFKLWFAIPRSLIVTVDHQHAGGMIGPVNDFAALLRADIN
jgi:hypothetical protein